MKLNKSQLDRLSEFTSNVGLVFLASIISPLFSGAVINYTIIGNGIFLTFSFLFISLIIIKK